MAQVLDEQAAPVLDERAGFILDQEPPLTVGPLTNPLLDEARAQILDESGLAYIGDQAAIPAQGSWWGLVSVLQHSRQEFEAFVSRPPMACPVCGEPLSPPPNTRAGAPMELYCKYAGDHHYQYPRDWHAPVRTGPGY